MLGNKVILITGASRGIGRAVAKCFAAHGATLILLSRSIADLTTLQNEIAQAGDPAPILYPFNLCSATLEDYDDLRRGIQNQFGRLDGLIHNAGILGALSPLEHYDIQHWYQVLQVNLNSVFILTQAMLPLLKAAPSAAVIFTSTEVGSAPKANWGAYAVAAAGCNTLREILAAECANLTQIRVGCVTPQRVRTRLRAAAYPAEDTDVLHAPEEFAQQYLDLMADCFIELNSA